MSIAMDSWRTKRQEWTKVRDNAHIKKGAVSGVSLGDRIERVYKASEKGYRPLLAAIDALQKDIQTYQTKGGKAVAPVSDWLKTLGNDLQTLEKAATSDVAMLHRVGPGLDKFHQTVGDGIPSMEAMQGAKQAVDRDTTGTVTWLDAAKKAELYDLLPAVLKMWAKVIKQLQSTTLKVTLPGKANEYKAVKEQAAHYEEYAKLLAKFTKVTTFDEHIARQKTAEEGMKRLAADEMRLKEHLKSLLG